MSKIDNAVAEVVSKITALAEQHGDQAIALITKTAEVAIVTHIVYTIFFLIVAIILFGCCAICFKQYNKYDQQAKDAKTAEERKVADEEAQTMVTAILPMRFVGILVLLLVIARTINPVIWYGLADPKIYLAYKIVEKYGLF